ncbi:MAG: hypothetical protein ACREP2_11200 [Rhodanobacteraceae bacterium]
MNAAPAKAMPHPLPHDFDFEFGRWRVRNQRLKSRLTGSGEWEYFDAMNECHPILGGMGNREEMVTDDLGDTRFIGTALRLFNASMRQWSIWWADNRRGVLEPPVHGAFADGVGTFHGDDVHDGRPVRVRFIWDARDPARPRWEQAFSPDTGVTWETNWVMTFSRIAAGDTGGVR